MRYKSVILGRRWGADGTPNAADGTPNAALNGLKDRDGLSWDRGGAVEGRACACACAPALTARLDADVPVASATTDVLDDLAAPPSTLLPVNHSQLGRMHLTNN